MTGAMARGRPVRRAAATALGLLAGTGGAAAQEAPSPAAGSRSAPLAPAERAASLRCFMLAAGAANSVHQAKGPPEQVGTFNTVAMFHLGRMAGAGAAPAIAEIEAELRAEQARPAGERPAVLRACGEDLQRLLGGLSLAAP
jgi:hypothetical protein